VRSKDFKVTPELKRKINRLAKIVGVKLNWYRGCGIQWNGTTIACKGQDASNIIHDIAHFAVATKKERVALDFGLGPGPDIYTEIKSLYGLPKCLKVEHKASALGIYWEKQLGFNWQSTAMYHAWEGLDLEKAWVKYNKTINKYKGI